MDSGTDFCTGFVTEIAKARNQDEFTDFTLTCGPDRFPVHKLVICTQSKVFRAACTGQFKEASTGELDMPEDDPAMVARMVEYLYSGKYEAAEVAETWISPEPETPLGDASSGVTIPETQRLTPIRIHARMFALADKYDIRGLQLHASEQYEKLATTIRAHQLLDSIPDVYDLTPESVRRLRDKAVMAARLAPEGELDHALGNPTLRKKTARATADMFRAVGERNPEFLKDLVASYIVVSSVRNCNYCAAIGKPQLQPMKATDYRCVTCGETTSKSSLQKRYAPRR
ncbi:hypothetical protein B0T16DRAFT_204744 [Cercophora newfieldiana]|uniref:BTB domain-containing protein n=1 Tax=Cercophora newfieldiana TaxID=92897 RepID=A0AA39XVM5_9PEZI|nr:hypothetical protein B0T16DRAFT_204744 [Cercophora newfieldiana]